MSTTSVRRATARAWPSSRSRPLPASCRVHRWPIPAEIEAGSATCPAFGIPPSGLQNLDGVRGSPLTKRCFVPLTRLPAHFLDDQQLFYSFENSGAVVAGDS